MKQANNHQLFLLDRNKTYQDPMPFFMQPVMGAENGLVFGFEILFRGGTPPEWSEIDKSVVMHLCDTPPDTLPTMFVNLCAKAFLEIPAQQFIDASKQNKVYFELSESVADDAAFSAILQKIDALSANGVLFALDDFGRTLDALPRAFALDAVSFIKVDGKCLAAAMADRQAEAGLRALLEQWRKAGISSVAEWIETPEMFAFAQQLGFDFVQGFHIDAMLNGLDSRDLDSAA
ncbi:MAG: EAL domain-containing protein [Burkholderiales bacterium]|nr:EAL domain-containing protein [Burkholderiales bacterium]